MSRLYFISSIIVVLLVHSVVSVDVQRHRYVQQHQHNPNPIDRLLKTVDELSQHVEQTEQEVATATNRLHDTPAYVQTEASYSHNNNRYHRAHTEEPINHHNNNNDNYNSNNDDFAHELESLDSLQAKTHALLSKNDMMVETEVDASDRVYSSVDSQLFAQIWRQKQTASLEEWESAPFYQHRFTGCAQLLKNNAVMKWVNILSVSSLVDLVKRVVTAPFKLIKDIGTSITNQGGAPVGEAFLNVFVDIIDSTAKAAVDATGVSYDEVGALLVGVSMAIASAITGNQRECSSCLLNAPDSIVQWSYGAISSKDLADCDIKKANWTYKMAESGINPTTASGLDLRDSYAKVLLGEAAIKALIGTDFVKKFIDGPFAKMKNEIKEAIRADESARGQLETIQAQLKIVELYKNAKSNSKTKTKEADAALLRETAKANLKAQFSSHVVAPGAVYSLTMNLLTRMDPSMMDTVKMFWCFGDAPVAASVEDEDDSAKDTVGGKARKQLVAFHNGINTAINDDEKNCVPWPRAWCHAPTTSKVAKKSAVDNYNVWVRRDSAKIGLYECSTIKWDRACLYSMDNVRYYIKANGDPSQDDIRFRMWVNAQDITPGNSFPCDPVDVNVP